MNTTPEANRLTITLFGKRNAGKSSLLNAIVGQDVALVSKQKGTTTDPVKKAMEFIPLGPVIFIDTAGIDDEGDLGKLRVERSKKMLMRTDFALYVMDGTDISTEDEKGAELLFKRFHIPFLKIINKVDLVDDESINELKEGYPDAVMVSDRDFSSIIKLKDEIAKRISKNMEEPPLVADLLPYGGTVVMVVPIDSEAPKGRIILPQAQCIRDCLDHGVKSYVVRDTELEKALEDLDYKVDLVITDSQAFKRVDEMVPPSIMLTSFSMIFARNKGNLAVFNDGLKVIEGLDENSKILIAESCTHNFSCEDIGRVKIPALLDKHLGKRLNYEFKMGHDFPENHGEYDLIIHCGACMTNRKTMQSRMRICKECGVAMTNYGVLLAYLSGILDRAMTIFIEDERAEEETA
ncbi:MAG: [FeFe] hydrogenase H-cluster maturation GTPase HydF [Peptostreptococcaceae bacterium]|nr:[FeFe] hydrogenase H-cluster maturation GTPase HydF [Peptostreptococcaceae bacterium]